MSQTLNGAVEQSDSDVESSETADSAADRDEPSEHESDMAGRLSRGLRRGLAFGLAALIAMTAIGIWWGLQLYDSTLTQRQRIHFLEVGRDSAAMLTTIDPAEAEADMRRILDSATGPFLDDFQKRSEPFIATVKRVQSKTEGTVVAAGLETFAADHAAVLVAVNVKTSLNGAQTAPRLWRMRISLQRVGHNTKVSNVEFVP